jgi:hypothetical protein
MYQSELISFSHMLLRARAREVASPPLRVSAAVPHARAASRVGCAPHASTATSRALARWQPRESCGRRSRYARSRDCGCAATAAPLIDTALTLDSQASVRPSRLAFHSRRLLGTASQHAPLIVGSRQTLQHPY